MEKTLTWLRNNTLINLFLAIAFFLAVVVFHDEVTVIAIKLRRSLSLSGYNLLFTVLTAVLFLAWTIWLFSSVRGTSRYRALYSYFVPTLLLIALFFMFMQTYSIEAVHFFQYAFLALLLFPLIKSYGATVFWTTMLGVLDEIHQYVILTPTFDYFDFNDMMLNLLGAGLAVVTIYLSTGMQYPGDIKRARLRSVLIFSLAIGIIFAFAYWMGYLRWYPSGGPGEESMLIINRTPHPDSFFIEAYAGKYFHILNQWEGILLGLVLFMYYFTLDWLEEWFHFPRK